MSELKMRYSCAFCGIVNLELELRERQPDETLEHYLGTAVNPALANSHASNSPDCKSNRLKNVQLPTSNEGVGYRSKPATVH